MKHLILITFVLIMACETYQSPGHDRYKTFAQKEREWEGTRQQKEQNIRYDREMALMEAEKEAEGKRERLKLKKAWRKQRCPLLVIDTSIRLNSIGVPIAVINFYNYDKKRTVDAITLDFRCYNTFGRRVGRYGSRNNKFGCIAQHLTIHSGEYQNIEWTLHGYGNTSRIKNVRVNEIHYTDDKIWRRRRRR